MGTERYAPPYQDQMGNGGGEGGSKGEAGMWVPWPQPLWGKDRGHPRLRLSAEGRLPCLACLNLNESEVLVQPSDALVSAGQVSPENRFRQGLQQPLVGSLALPPFLTDKGTRNKKNSWVPPLCPQLVAPEDCPKQDWNWHSQAPKQVFLG